MLPSGKSSVLTWFAPVPKSISVSSIESAAKLTAPLLTLKWDDEKEATPLLLVVASTPATVRFGYVPPFVTPLDPTTAPVWSGAVLAIVNVFAASSYVALIDVPATTKLLTLSSTLSSVKYKLLPSLKSVVDLLDKSKFAPVFNAILASALAFVKYKLVPSESSVVDLPVKAESNLVVV